MIVFEKSLKQARILSPLKNFEEDVVTFEYRTDPLTGRNTTVINGMLSYIKRFLPTDEMLLKAMLEQSRANCPFCPENALEKTPMFPRYFLEEGRIIVGDAIVTPNLLGHAECSILVILSKQHHLKLSEFTTEIILNGFKGASAHLTKLARSEPSIRFPAFIFNYLPPAGSSIIHPHMQV
jgi:UDPglucose--hexose-1-phosphate uridylyltransferase